MSKAVNSKPGVPRKQIAAFISSFLSLSFRRFCRCPFVVFAVVLSSFLSLSFASFYRCHFVVFTVVLSTFLSLTAPFESGIPSQSGSLVMISGVSDVQVSKNFRGI